MTVDRFTGRPKRRLCHLHSAPAGHPLEGCCGHSRRIECSLFSLRDVDTICHRGHILSSIHGIWRNDTYCRVLHAKYTHEFVFQVHFGCSRSLFGYLSGLGIGSGPKYPRAKAADYGQPNIINVPQHREFIY